jgi:hypothetical protein
VVKSFSRDEVGWVMSRDEDGWVIGIEVREVDVREGDDDMEDGEMVWVLPGPKKRLLELFWMRDVILEPSRVRFSRAWADDVSGFRLSRRRFSCLLSFS